ncbi:hypothetical protein GGQ92_000680 [Gracilibacillus halotolerans]|uniref:Post-transcriptional regulator n=1 Tax=Gracilibacillus halotolerans TaxID=74386 RepID=A0A841RJV0_9BACI|nr:post-transcriptional regulator [Gracilibacillus halotolerans]MBB6511913.1 hypothetical protein [Gracilibacillus halotolerans]
MSIKKPVSEWKKSVTEILDSKVSEFHLLEYSKATPENVWVCLTEKVWRGNPEKALHEVVQDIFHLSPNVYMTYLTQQSFMDNNLKETLDAILGAVTEE